MELGFFTMPIHPHRRSPAETLEEDREFVLLAEELGFVEGFIGEHVTDAAENITSSLIFIAWGYRRGPMESKNSLRSVSCGVPRR